ncbi:UbiA family prenyltransferase [Kaistella sp. PBT33-4]|uniref:UbiA family prenyltransferase n=1 Tax=Kaistella sp. PBT33-4 TaxID=3032000 RepID=UPI0023D7CFA9|nr:UbiA family prenyltransferase [Kaistella sp. PBT33-4]MDF0719636.1 UbiA family prenyltransferase [Kaistella sp. PBT33-4]
MKKKPVIYRISQLTGFLLGARFFMTVLLAFALYVSTFFLFNQEESLRAFVFDFRVHAIIFCSLLSILAGGIINQFYDREKDRLVKPFRSRLQAFLKQKYFLYAYLILNTLSLGIALLISARVVIFFLIYQFLMWLYSHRLSRMLVINNVTFVALTLYPFFGMLVYYRTFSVQIFMMALYLTLMLLLTDIIKDTLTKKADRLFGYMTIPNHFNEKTTSAVISVLLGFTFGVSLLITDWLGLERVMGWYFLLGLIVLAAVFFQMKLKRDRSRSYALNMLRIWIFVGILAMLADGIILKY